MVKLPWKLPASPAGPTYTKKEFLMTVKEAAITILKKAGKPLHLKEITNKIMSEGLWESTSKEPPQSVSGEMQRHSKDDDESSIFQRVAPNTYALRNDFQNLLMPDSYTFLEAAELVLQQAPGQSPMHYKEITRLAIEKGWLKTRGKTPKGTMNSRLSTHIIKFNSRDKIPNFYRSAPGYYGLTSCKKEGLSNEIIKQKMKVRTELLNYIRQMDPQAVEELAGLLLAEMGFDEVEVTPYHKDHGIDVEGVLILGGAIRIKMLVQVKRQHKKITSANVQQIRGCLGEGDQGIILCTSDFTINAKEEAVRPGRAQISLINGEQFVSLLMKHKIGIKQKTEILYTFDQNSLIEIVGKTHQNKSN